MAPDTGGAAPDADRGPDRDGGRGGRERPDDAIADVGAFIRSQREVAKMSVRKLAELAGVSNPYLSQIERGIRRPSAEILQQLAEALRISAETLYVRAGFLHADETRRTPTVAEAIEHDPDLSDEQKAALLEVYRSFTSGSR